MSQNRYEIRDEAGVLKFKLSAELAQQLVKHSKGHFREAKFNSGEQKRIYEFDDDYKFGDIERLGYELHIWKGDKLSMWSPDVTAAVRGSSMPRVG